MKSLDSFGGSIQITHNNCSTLQSNFGAFITFLNLFIVSLLFYAFGKDFFTRKNPSVVNSSISTIEYPFIKNLTLTNYTFAFRFENVDGALIELPDQIYFQLLNYYYRKNEKLEYEYIYIKPLNFSKCDKSNFIEINLTDYFCLDDNFSIRGNYPSDDINLLSLEVYRCLENSTNPITHETCAKDTIKDVNFNNLYLTIIYQSIIFEPNSYSDPLKKKLLSTYLLLDQNYYKSFNLYLNEVILTNDYGWLLTNINNSTAFTSRSDRMDFFTKDKSESLLAGIYMYGENKYDYYYREYPKLQSLVAQVGGVLEFFITISKFLVENYNFISFNISISKLHTKKSGNVLNNNNQEEFNNNKALKNGEESSNNINIIKSNFSEVCYENKLEIKTSRKNDDNLVHNDIVSNYDVAKTIKFKTKILEEEKEKEFRSPFYYLFATNCVFSVLCSKFINKEEVSRYIKLEENYYKSLNYSTIFMKSLSNVELYEIP